LRTGNGAILCGGISATDPLVDDAKKAPPAIPTTDTTLPGRFTFMLRFACGTAEFLLAYFSSNKCVRTLAFSRSGTARELQQTSHHKQLAAFTEAAQ
jgi:hypothetical protein